MTEIMNALAFDAMAIGNQEFDWGMDTLWRLRTAARTPGSWRTSSTGRERAPGV